MAFNNSSFAVELPSSEPSLGSVLEHGIALKERQQARSDALLQRQQEAADRLAAQQEQQSRSNRLYNLKQIQEATAQKQYETPNHIIDNQLGQELSSINNDAMKYLSESPEFVSQFIKDRVGRVAQWTDLAKQHAQQIAAQTTEFNKTLPNTDLNKITGLTAAQFKDNFLTKNDKGEYAGLKDPHLIQQTVDYMQPIVNNPSIMAQVTNNTAPLDKFLQDIPKIPYENNSYVNNKGQVVAKKVGGYLSKHSQLGYDEQGLPIAEAKYETAPFPLTGKGGQPLRLATPELRAEMNANPLIENSFNKRWEDYKTEKGLNLDPHTNDILKENFRYELANNNLGHHLKIAEIEKTPAPRITVNVGGKETQIKDAYSEIINKLPENDTALSFNKLTPTTQDAVLKLARENYGTINVEDPNDPKKIKQRPLNQKDIVIYKNPKNGEVGVWTIKQDEKGTPRVDQFIAPLGEYDVNAQVNKGVKAKQQVLKNEAKSGNLYTVNGKDMQHDELIKMGYTDAQINKALQLGTIKHK